MSIYATIVFLKNMFVLHKINIKNSYIQAMYGY
jgi:hypothetical protein